MLRHIIVVTDDPGEDNIIASRYLVANGYARTFAGAPNNRYRDLLSTAQTAAHREKKGMWGECEIVLENQDKREVNSEPTDPDCNIKGNISEKGYGKTYLMPGCDNYKTVKIDTRKGEQYFCTEEEAIEAGFRKATNCP